MKVVGFELDLDSERWFGWAGRKLSEVIFLQSSGYRDTDLEANKEKWSGRIQGRWRIVGDQVEKAGGDRFQKLLNVTGMLGIKKQVIAK